MARRDVRGRAHSISRDARPRALGWPIAAGRALSLGLALLLAALLLALGGPVAAQDAGGQIDIEIMLSQTSDGPGGVEKRAARLDAKLREQFRYTSLRVLETRKFRLGPGELGTMKLPTGSQLRVSPISVDDRGALLAVDVEGVLKTDLRVKSRHLIVIGAQRHGDGKLVISLEPRF